MTGARAWQEYCDATFGSSYSIWHEGGIDYRIVTAMEPAARREAIAMLRLGLAEGDPYAGQALAELGDAASLPGLRRQLAKSLPQGAFVTKWISAIIRLAPDPELAAPLVQVLLANPKSWNRIDAAHALVPFDDQESEAALLEAVGDRNYLVRFNASTALLRRWNVRPSYASDHPNLFALIRGPDLHWWNAWRYSSSLAAARLELRRIQTVAHPAC